MRRSSSWLWLAALVAAANAAAAQQRRDGDLKVGDPAPDFVVSDVDGKNVVRLSDLRGRPVVLLFGSCT